MRLEIKHNDLKPMIILIIADLKIKSVLQEKYSTSSLNWLVLFKAIMAVYFVNDKKLINILIWQKEELLSVKTCSI
jgi:hypothetical protein